jgi:plasmid maintenance system antidote protein VapI
MNVPHNVPYHSKTAEENILDEMNRQNISFSGLARALHIERTHLTRSLKNTGGEKRKLSAGLQKRIEDVLGKEFSATTTSPSSS